MSPSNEQKIISPILRRADQLVLACATVLALTAMIAYWVYQGGLAGRLIEIDDAPPREAQFQVDINRATWPEIAQLPRIGEVLAKRIVQSRKKQGFFHSIEELQRVRGIGPATINQMKPYLLPIAPSDSVAIDADR